MIENAQVSEGMCEYKWEIVCEHELERLCMRERENSSDTEIELEI